MINAGGLPPAPFKERMKLMEEKQIKANVTKAGGTASKNNQMVRLIIPASWARQIGITKENPFLNASFDGEKIVLERMKENDHQQQM